MKLIIDYLMRHKKYFFLNLFAVILISVAELGIPLAISGIIDNALSGELLASNMSLIYKYSIILGIIAIIGTIGNILSNYTSVKTATLILIDIRYDVFKKVQTFTSEEISEYGVSSLITRTTSDVYQILTFVTTFFRVAFMSPTLIIISIFLIATRIPTLLVSTLISIPIIIFGIFLVIVLTKPLSQRQQKNLDDLNLITRENLTGVRVIRAFRKNKYEKEKFEKANEKYTSTAEKLFKIMTATEPVFFLILNTIIVITLYFGGQRVISSMGVDLSVGKLTEFFDYQFLVSISILMFAMLFILYPRTIVSSNRIRDVLNTDVKIKNKENPLTYVEPKGTLEFKDVEFKFKDSELPTLTNINLSFKKGETIAFIGSTGSGKSTLINLIPRMFDVSKGEILFDGVNIQDFDLNYLRSKIGFISQKAILFNDTIINNIRYGKKDATLEEVIAAAKIAQAHDFIMSKELGYEDPITEMGANLSGGQKQRVSITRAIVKNPDIYIYDRKLRDAIKPLSKNAITLIVAQRVASIIDADQIVVLNEGEIVGLGTHDELIKSNKIYIEIANSQQDSAGDDQWKSLWNILKNIVFN